MSSISDFFNNLSTTGITNLSSVFTSMGAGGVSAVVGGLSGPSNNAQGIGKLLGKVPAFYAAGNSMGLMMVETQVAPMEAGLSSTAMLAIANVWDQVNIPNNQSQVINAVTAAKTALGLSE